AALPLTTSYQDFVALERLALQAEPARVYWEQQVADAPPSPLSYWREPSSNSETSDIHLLSLPIPNDLHDDLQRLARKAGVPLRSVLLAAHLKVMSLLSGQADVLSGVVTHGRPEGPDGERVPGL